MGIQTLKSFLLWLVSVILAIREALEDGKIKGFEIFTLLGQFQEVLVIAPQLPTVKEEFLGLDADEKEELVAAVNEVFELEDKHIEELIERWFDQVAGFALLLKDTFSAVKAK